ncbi:ammonium transporter [Waterburya agarophytonicola K14]|uniref:Ammonium transporter n=1 Tax=Waterburya agarophytonicola KI4 TaxID=2874699 RepID=A0A964FFH8_9CYAN|nr:ammonium transporter [Waterburya agarophytonicola]MCC0176982.1 ammonium transporter [Waterburya agarophytonicola KI4]
MFASIFQSKPNLNSKKKKSARLPFSPYWIACIPLVAIILITWNTAAMAQDAQPLTLESVQGALNSTWVLVAAILVIFMNAGFAMLESGFCRRKNVVNVLAKNLLVFALATMSFWSIGFSIMFSGVDSPFAGNEGFFLSSSNPAVYGLEPYPQGLPIAVFFLFQAAFAGTAATIVSGAVAERIQFVSYAMFSLLLTAIAYPIVGHWVFTENGWLTAQGFYDFAGSTVVHSVGGWAALVGAIILGARKGKYQEDGRVNPMPGHNMSMATLGCFILWIGWFGFNGGSELAANEAVPYIVLTSNLAAMSGALSATITSWLRDDKPDLSMIINGILAGFVAITASCYVVDYFGAVMIGLISGILVVFAISLLESLKVDDPVGAISVHLICGIWGTLAVGLIANPKNLLQKSSENPISGLVYSGNLDQLIAQMTGILSVGAFTLIFSIAAWFFIKLVFGLRVPEKAELDGLDISEHEMEAYHGFVKESDMFGSSFNSDT